MNNLMQEIDDRASLAGTNRLEVLLFCLEERDEKRKELFGVNVFKVKEILTVPKLTKIPLAPRCMKGMANIRGVSIPVIDLMQYCGVETPSPRDILIVTEYNNSEQGFLVYDVDNIHQLAWSDILQPPEMIAGINSSIITGVSEHEDKRMILILDLEKVLSDVLGPIEEKEGSTIDMASDGSLKGKTVFYTDDSAVARKQVESVLERMGADSQFTTDGLKAWNKLCSLADEADKNGVKLCDSINAIITDVEMPGMDGFMLTKNIKDDNRFTGIPVIMHSSLSSTSNQLLGEKCGVDAYVPKLQPKLLSDVLESYLIPDSTSSESKTVD
jgi:two-component system chemotaxis response regulator CheV